MKVEKFFMVLGDINHKLSVFCFEKRNDLWLGCMRKIIVKRWVQLSRLSLSCNLEAAVSE